ncbi:MAG TPA: hypothetical protein VD867_01565 [Burkholderiales bacterium]|nr:hypothetical protein [Burkholderiales bacterium]
MRILVAALTFAVAASAGAQQYETAAEFKAAEFAPAALLKGPLHTIDEKVVVERGLPRFTIRSKHGTWEARGVEMLAIRVSELPAFAQLESVSKTDEFVKATGRALAAPIKTTGQLITNPIDTTGNIVSGIGMMVGRVGRTAGAAATRVGDTGADTGKKGIAVQQVKPELGTAEPRGISDPLGFNTARREWAKRLNVDPYTSNAPLGDKLSQMASASFAGSLPVDLTLGAVVAPLHYASVTNNVAQAQAYQLPPNDLEAANERKLKAMGIEGLPVRTFFRNRYFTPTLQTALVFALESLGNVSGRGEIITFAGRASSEAEARYVNNSLTMLSLYSRSGTPIASVRGADNVIAGQTRDGKLIIPAPLDYVAWVQPVEDFARRSDLKGSERTVLLAGKATPRATKELATLGWRVNENVTATR